MTLIIPFITKWKKGDITIRSMKTTILTFPQTPTPLNHVLEEDYQVDFNHQNSIAKVFGFTSPKYTEGFQESENVVNILSINSILVNIDIISGSHVNGTTRNTIYSFFPKVSSGYKIIKPPVNLVYLPITLDVIDS